MAMADNLGQQFQGKHAGPNNDLVVKLGAHPTQGEARIAAGRVLPGKHAKKEKQ